MQIQKLEDLTVVDAAAIDSRHKKVAKNIKESKKIKKYRARVITLLENRDAKRRIAGIRERETSLDGFIEVVKELEAAEFFTFNQGEGWLDRADFTTNTDELECHACIGAVADWYFSNKDDCDFDRGSKKLAKHMGIPLDELKGAIKWANGVPPGKNFYAFATTWKKPYSEVLEEVRNTIH